MFLTLASFANHFSMLHGPTFALFSNDNDEIFVRCENEKRVFNPAMPAVAATQLVSQTVPGSGRAGDVLAVANRLGRNVEYYTIGRQQYLEWFHHYSGVQPEQR